MKKHTSFSTLFLVMLIIAASFQYEANGQKVQGIWNGTISRHVKGTGSLDQIKLR